ncbi:MAG: cation transporter [Crocinitomicaceae bacterium]|jgi:Co/Zn/Cd efflux system component|nr:cation transporter [Crocinitomicaceae bacterium]|tara:strand:+ start:127 stop:933 length:807 start_codon:yes stop_codon:yes gene_type:complete
MYQTLFKIDKMDCPSEENLIRMKFEELTQIKHLEFDLNHRELTVFHKLGIEEIEECLKQLNLGHKKLYTKKSNRQSFDQNTDQRKVLWSVLIINLVFFILEMGYGLVSKSMGLVADSLDMLADSFVYAISLIAVGKSLTHKKTVAKIAGYFQIILALIGFGEVIRRTIYSVEFPNYLTMIIISVLALVGNALCLYLLQKSKDKDEAHIKASLIFTSNDVVINLGVIVAGLMVYWLNSNMPDLIIGAIVFFIVSKGAIRILSLSKNKVH